MFAKLAYVDVKLEKCQLLDPELNVLDIDLLGYSAVREEITMSWVPVLQFDRIAKATIFDKTSNFVDQLSKKVKT